MSRRDATGCTAPVTDRATCQPDERSTCCPDDRTARRPDEQRGLAVDDPVPIDREADPDRWRCPRGHTDWALGYGDLVHCYTCAATDRHCDFAAIVDVREDRRVPAERATVVAGKRWLSERWR